MDKNIYVLINGKDGVRMAGVMTSKKGLGIMAIASSNSRARYGHWSVAQGTDIQMEVLVANVVLYSRSEAYHLPRKPHQSLFSVAAAFSHFHGLCQKINLEISSCGQ